MKKSKFYSLIFVLSILTLSFSTVSFAHQGRTDANGGHHDYKNKSGLGSYHYHHGMGPHLHPGGVCPYGYNSQPEVYTPPSPSISLNSYPTSLYVGESSGIDFSVNNATNDSFSIASSNPEIVTVNPDNTLIATGEGVSTITISSSGTTESFTIEVHSIPVESVAIINQIERLQLGESHKLECQFMPENATNKQITWSSNDESILSIDSNGNISANSIGVAIISYVTSNNITGEFPVEVYEVYPEQIITNFDNLNLEIGTTASLSIHLLPENTNNLDCNISIENNNVIDINEDLFITPLNDGTTKVIITTCNNITKEIPITIYHTPVENISIDNSKIDYITFPFLNNAIDCDSTIKLGVIITPSNASIKDIEWESSNPNIISVEDGEFVINNTGNVTLTAYGYDNTTESISFNVVDPSEIIGMISVCALGIGAVGIGTGYFVYSKKSKNHNQNII